MADQALASVDGRAAGRSRRAGPDPGRGRPHHPGAVRGGRNPVAAALTRRAGALLRGDAGAVLATAAAFAQAGYPYQQARALALGAAAGE